MGILFAILKIIGIILLVIAAIIAVILFVPILYEADGDSRKKNAHVRASWLFGLLRFRFAYEKSSAAYAVHLLWFQILPRDGTSGKGKKKGFSRKKKSKKDQSWWEEENDDFSEPEQKKAGTLPENGSRHADGSAENIGDSDRHPDRQSEGQNTAGRKESKENIKTEEKPEQYSEIQKKSSGSEFQENDGQKSDETSEFEEAQAEQAKAAQPSGFRNNSIHVSPPPEEAADQQQKETAKRSGRRLSSGGGKKNKSRKKVSGSFSGSGKRFGKGGRNKRYSGRSGDGITSRLRKGFEIFQQYREKGLFGRLFRALMKFLMRIRPRKLAGTLQFGFSDPSVTGRVLGAVAMIPFIYQTDLAIEPDFETEKAYFQGDAYLKGHLQLFFVLVFALRLLLNKDFRSFLSKVKKLG